MKTLKLVCMAMFCMAVSLASCSPEDGQDGQDGATGPQGIAGVDGADGADGISCWDLNGNGVGDAEEDINDDGNFDAMDCQGADGTNGNANVQAFDINLDEWGGMSQYNFNMFNDTTLPDDQLENYIFFFYLKGGNRYYSVPGPMDSNIYYSRVRYDVVTGISALNFYLTSNNSNYNVPLGTFSLFRIIAVEIGSMGAKGQDTNAIKAELKAAGVDTSDYNQVAAYFGLE